MREKLIELIQEAVDGCATYWAVKIADHLITNGVTVQEWIPVSEPPILPGDYLCYFEFEPESSNIICEDTYNEGGHWMTEKEKITHWMPLPLPPGKGKGKC